MSLAISATGPRCSRVSAPWSQRCLAKAIALHGLGLYLYAGEDLPTPPKPLTKKQYTEINNVMASIPNFKPKDVLDKIDSGIINESNYKVSLAKLKRLSNVKS